MKKIISILLCLAVVTLSFAGCSKTNAKMTEKNITATVEVTVDALKNFDTKKLSKYVDSSTLDVISSYADQHKQIRDLGKAIFENLEYEIVSIDIENKTVKLSVKNKDLSEPAKEFATDLKQNYTTLQLLSKLSNEGFLDRKLGDMKDAIGKSSMSEDATIIELDIEQGNKNLVLVFDKDDENAVSGGALGSVSSIFSAGSAISGIIN